MSPANVMTDRPEPILYVDFSSPDAGGVATPGAPRSPKGGARLAPTESSEHQTEFEFSNQPTESGYTKWLATREAAVRAVARKLDLPLGAQVELWLNGGIRLRGKLRLQNEPLIIDDQSLADLPLTVDGIVFPFSEIESCVRLD